LDLDSRSMMHNRLSEYDLASVASVVALDDHSTVVLTSDERSPLLSFVLPIACESIECVLKMMASSTLGHPLHVPNPPRVRTPLGETQTKQSTLDPKP
jgi:hypothetical protein